MANLKIEERFTVDAPVATVWSFLTDPVQVATCLPGAKLDGSEGADTYLGAMKVKVGPVSSEFRGKATLSEVDASQHTLKLTGTGEDKSGGGSARLTMRCAVLPSATGGAEVSVDAEVELAGKLVRFGRGLIEGVSKQLFKQFVERARTRLGAAAPAAAAATGEAAIAADPPAPPSEAPFHAQPAPDSLPKDRAPPAAAEAAADPTATAPAVAAPLAPPAAPGAAAQSTAPAALAIVEPTIPAALAVAEPTALRAALAAAEPAAPTTPKAAAGLTAPLPLGDIGGSAAPVSAPAQLTTPTPANDDALDAGALVWQEFKGWLLGWFRRLFRRRG